MNTPEINFINSLYPKGQETPRSGNRVSRNLKKLSILFAAIAFIVIMISFGPSLWYLVRGGSGQNSKVLGAFEKKEFGDLTQVAEESVYQPSLDTTLPKENRITIPSAKIDTIVHEATTDNYEEALKQGVWRVSDFGDPYSRSKPTILAAHRFGYLKWSIPYRLKNSFYSLPKTGVGDTVEITWRQRKYVYEIYAEEEGEKITNYKADLILYTCEDLTSPTRIFKYARLLEV